jgi:hypothetical protein
MKDRKRFLLVFAVCWVIGLTGGYFLGLGSAILPSENVEYTYYYSEKASDSDVEPVKKCSKTETDNCKEAEAENDKFFVVIKNVVVLELPKRLLGKLTGN